MSRSADILARLGEMALKPLPPGYEVHDDFNPDSPGLRVWVTSHGKEVGKAVFDKFEGDPSRAEALLAKIQQESSRAPLYRAESLLDRLGEGSKGDWEKEGYILSHVDTIDNAESPHFGDKNYRNLIISARDKSGKWAARTHISYPFGGFDKPSTKYKGEIMRTDVDPKDRRKGIATAMYRYAEKILGGPLHPGGEQSPDAKALWANPGRAFGSKA